MTYTPTVWKTGDIVTADKLNHAEEGIANAGGGGNYFIHAHFIRGDEMDTFFVDETFDQINQAFLDGKNVILNLYNETIQGNTLITRYSLSHYYLDAQNGGLYSSKEIEFGNLSENREFIIYVQNGTITNCGIRESVIG